MTNLYVGNLSFKATETDVRQAFEGFGAVDNVFIITDKNTGRSRGFAFVEMPDAEAAKKAIEGLDGQEILGRPVSVNETRPRPERSDRGDGRRFRGDGGRRGGHREHAGGGHREHGGASQSVQTGS